MLKKSYLCKAISVAKFCGIKESALLLVKSPNLNKEYTRHGAAHIRGLPIRVVYRRHLQVFGDTYKRIRRAAHFL